MDRLLWVVFKQFTDKFTSSRFETDNIDLCIEFMDFPTKYISNSKYFARVDFLNIDKKKKY